MKYYPNSLVKFSILNSFNLFIKNFNSVSFSSPINPNGTMKRQSSRFWINKTRKISAGDKIYYMTSSQYFNEPEKLSSKFGQIVAKDTLRIRRNGKTVKNLFIYQMMDPRAIAGSF